MPTHLHDIAHNIAHVHVDIESLEVYGKQHQCFPGGGAGFGLRRTRAARAGPSLVMIYTKTCFADFKTISRAKKSRNSKFLKFIIHKTKLIIIVEYEKL